VARDAEGARAVESDAAPDLDEPREIPPPLAPHRVSDRELRAVRAAIARRLAALRRSAPGIHPVPELDGRRLGRSYRQLQARLATGAVAERLETLAYAHARPSPDDLVFYVRQGSGPVRTAAEVAEAFELPAELPAAEAAALQALVTTLETQLAAHPTLRAYRLQAGWGDAVGAGYHGVAIVPSSGDEVLWVFTEEIWCEC